MKDKIKNTLLMIGITLVTGFSCFIYNRYNFSGINEIALFSVTFILILMLFFFTTYRGSFVDFVSESKIELYKVVWPTRQETIQTTLIVVVMVTISGMVLWGIDSLLTVLIAKLTQVS